MKSFGDRGRNEDKTAVQESLIPSLGRYGASAGVAKTRSSENSGTLISLRFVTGSRRIPASNLLSMRDETWEGRAFPASEVQLRGKACGNAEGFAEGFRSLKRCRTRSAGCQLDLQWPPVLLAKHPRRPQQFCGFRKETPAASVRATFRRERTKRAPFSFSSSLWIFLLRAGWDRNNLSDALRKWSSPARTTNA